jgi:hypothetical protein
MIRFMISVRTQCSMLQVLQCVLYESFATPTKNKHGPISRPLYMYGHPVSWFRQPLKIPAVRACT